LNKYGIYYKQEEKIRKITEMIKYEDLLENEELKNIIKKFD
jgi:hypothetical protein